MVDLSKVPGYGYLTTVNLGDGISVIDPVLEINVSYRVLSRERNPFQKINPRVQIGNLIRDFTDYIREDIEEKEEEDPTINYFLQSFQIGKVNCMALSGVELDAEDVLPWGISASVDYYIEGEHKGLTLSVKPQYANYHVTIVEYYEDDAYEEYDLSNIAGAIKDWAFPKPNMTGFAVTVSEVPLNELDPEIHKFRDYGVKFNKVYIDPLRELKIGKKNVLGMNPIVDPENGNVELSDFSATINYSLMNEHKGMKLSLRREFQNYKVYIVLLDSDGNSTKYDYETVKDQIGTWDFPNQNAEYALVVIQEKPDGEFNTTKHKKVIDVVARNSEPEPDNGPEQLVIFTNPYYREFDFNVEEWEENYVDMRITNYDTKYIVENMIEMTQDTSAICGAKITFTTDENTKVWVGLDIFDKYNPGGGEIYWVEQDVSAGTHTLSIPFAQVFYKSEREVRLVIDALNGNIIVRNNAVHAYIKGRNISTIPKTIS